MSGGQPTRTPLQTAVSVAVGSYRAACRLLDTEERAILRSVLASAIARDAADAIGTLDNEERAA